MLGGWSASPLKQRLQLGRRQEKGGAVPGGRGAVADGWGWSPEGSGFPIGMDSYSLKFWEPSSSPGNRCCLALGTQAS